MNQKEQANDYKGNFLRNKACRLIADITLRYATAFEQFCGMIVQQLDQEEIKSENLEAQIKKDAMY